MNLLLRVTSYVLCVITLSACTGGDHELSDGPAARQSASRAAIGEELVGDWGAEPRLRDGATEPWIRFQAGGSFDGYDGCSHVSGPWAVDGDGETVTARKVAVVGTACAPDREASFTSMRLDGDQLVYEVASGDTRRMGRRD